MTGTSKKGREQSPPRARKKAAPKTSTKPKRTAASALKQSKPPPLPNDGVGGVVGWHGQLFTVEDITAISEATGMTVLPNKLEVAPERLRHAFDSALIGLETPKLQSPPHVWRDWLTEVHKRAESLLSILHFPPGTETIKEYDLTFPWDGHQHHRRTAPNVLLCESFFADLPQHFLLLPEQVREVFKHYPEQNQKEGNWHKVQPGTTRAALEMAPWIIALISEIGRQGAARWNEMAPGTRGREPFTEILFMYLANAYEELTGKPPSGMQGSGADAGQSVPNAPPILWAKAVLKMAADRFDVVTSGYGGEAVEAIRAAGKLSDARITRLFKAQKNAKDTEYNNEYLQCHDKDENSG